MAAAATIPDISRFRYASPDRSCVVSLAAAKRFWGRHVSLLWVARLETTNHRARVKSFVVQDEQDRMKPECANDHWLSPAPWCY